MKNINKKLLTVLMSTSIVLTACSVEEEVPKSKSIADVKKNTETSIQSSGGSDYDKNTEKDFFNKLEYYSNIDNLKKFTEQYQGTAVVYTEISKGDGSPSSEKIFSNYESHKFVYNKDGKFFGGNASVNYLGDKEPQISLQWYGDKNGNKFDNINISKNSSGEKTEEGKDIMFTKIHKDFTKGKEIILKKYDVYKESFKGFGSEEDSKFYLYWDRPKDDNGIFGASFNPIYTNDKELVEIWNQEENKDILLDELKKEERDSVEITSITVGLYDSLYREKEDEKKAFTNAEIKVFYKAKNDTNQKVVTNFIEFNTGEKTGPDLDGEGKTDDLNNRYFFKFGKPSTEYFPYHQILISGGGYHIG
ncbi:MAG: hypothetical protein Q3988_03100 [Gemella sp.]|nr:hypothetical protein [Gemella sp.]